MPEPHFPSGRVLALCGGIGGAKLALGLYRAMPPEALTLVVNTGDDFRHFGLAVSPDIDTVTYALAGRANTQTGWGRGEESWRFMDAVRELGGEDWFGLGDTDLATKAVRTQWLAQGRRLSEATAMIARALGVGCAVQPATDDPIPTIVETDEGDLAFQHYFVRRRWQPAVRGLRYQGAADAALSPETARALADPELAAIVICPSNPWLSILPILAVPGLREALAASPAPVVAVAPLVGAQAIKGPLAKMMVELGMEPSLQNIADAYDGLLDVLIVDEADRHEAVSGPKIVAAPIVMHSLDDRIAVARAALAAARAERR
ncbi:2-phospho-L-lactate transferase [Mesorhizobium sp. Root552]|jgi:LPPG:FO 2-phospho-L-lactate transferase|uniref:2-phospho-L-lactate transferase n=1 Tax=Mesorhizobium sp. Root552 TaxID=1736555 RepID=UPI0006F5BDD7|nr:2-phospho-L-lactate transferase [Mesorhizobium sp. Root552]KQZ25746.1 2-phospho-L-lactate transferase [Mesorhizobium sp. Root552]